MATMTAQRIIDNTTREEERIIDNHTREEEAAEHRSSVIKLERNVVIGTPPPHRRALQRCRRRASALAVRCLTCPDAAAASPRAPAVPMPRLRAA